MPNAMATSEEKTERIKTTEIEEMNHKEEMQQ